MNNKINKQNKVKELYNKIIEAVQNFNSSEEYKKFLRFSNNFHKYSFNNIILIYSQMEEATQVAGFKTWQKIGRNVKKGEKGIQIMYPIKINCRKKVKKEESNINSQEEKQEDLTTITYLTYRPTYVFDISQTEGEELPLSNNKLNTSSMSEFLEILRAFSPCPIFEKPQKEMHLAEGYYSKKDNQIIIQENLSIDDKTSTLLHELTHALYDDFDYTKDRDLSETFVESVAYIVADNFGLDTSKCSFRYIGIWSSGDSKTILKLGDKIQKTANDFIQKLEKFNQKSINIAA